MKQKLNNTNPKACLLIGVLLFLLSFIVQDALETIILLVSAGILIGTGGYKLYQAKQYEKQISKYLKGV